MISLGKNNGKFFLEKGYVVSGGYDKKICIWNIEAAS